MLEHAGVREPGKGDPGRENRVVALIGPVFALEGFGGCCTAALRGGENGPLRSGGRLAARLFDNETGGGEFFQRIVHLRPGDVGPIADAAPLQLEIGFVAVHRALGQEAEQHQVGNS